MFIQLNKIYLTQVTQGTVPWKSILTSPPVWGIIAAAFASDWGLYVLLICVPLFLMDILHYEVAAVRTFAFFVEKIKKNVSVTLISIHGIANQ